MNFRIVTKNHAADPEIEFLTKSISKPYGRATAKPTAWELSPHDIVIIEVPDLPVCHWLRIRYQTGRFLAQIIQKFYILLHH